MKKADRIFGVICLGISLWCFIESQQFDYVTEFTPGPGFLPFWAGIILALLACYLLVDTFRRRSTEEDTRQILPVKHALSRVGFIVLMLVLARVLISYLGFPITIGLFVAVILVVLERYPLFKSVGYGIAYAAFTWIVFGYFLEIAFPKGILGI